MEDFKTRSYFLCLPVIFLSAISVLLHDESVMDLFVGGLSIWLGNLVFRLLITTRSFFKKKELINWNKIYSKFGGLEFLISFNGLLVLLACLVVFFFIYSLQITGYNDDTFMLIYIVSIASGFMFGLISSIDRLMIISIPHPQLTYKLRWQTELCWEKIFDMGTRWLSIALIIMGFIKFILNK